MALGIARQLFSSQTQDPNKQQLAQLHSVLQRIFTAYEQSVDACSLPLPRKLRESYDDLLSSTLIFPLEDRSEARVMSSRKELHVLVGAASVLLNSADTHNCYCWSPGPCSLLDAWLCSPTDALPAPSIPSASPAPAAVSHPRPPPCTVTWRGAAARAWPSL